MTNRLPLWVRSGGQRHVQLAPDDLEKASAQTPSMRSRSGRVLVTQLFVLLLELLPLLNACAPHNRG